MLDLGSGTGDVAFVAAELVGPAGEVVGIDRSPEAVATAQARTQQRGLGNVSFVVGDIHEPAPGGPFDAIVGRLVLMYVPDPAVVLRTQAALLRPGPGGVVAPIEFDLGSARSLPPTPLAHQMLAWLIDTFQRAGVEPSLGARLWAILQQAGLRPLGMVGVQPHFGPDDPAGPATLAGIVGTMLPLIEHTGVATAQQVGIETLQALGRGVGRQPGGSRASHAAERVGDGRLSRSRPVPLGVSAGLPCRMWCCAAGVEAAVSLMSAISRVIGSFPQEST
jgi:hypothetical protein